MRRDKNAPALLELIGRGQIASSAPSHAPAPSARPPVQAAPARAASVPAPTVMRSAPTAAPVAAAPAHAPSHPSHADTATGSWFAPGRAIRVPVGYVVPGVLLAAALLVGAYATGYQARKAEDQRVQSAAAAREMAGLVDPLNHQAAPESSPRQAAPARQSTMTTPTQRQTGGGVANRQAAGTGAAQPRQTDRQAQPQGTSTPAKQGGVVVVSGKGDDPRQSGLNYLIAATLPPDEAMKAAQFLNSQGLEIAVVPADNAPLRWVVVLQGVAAKDLAGSAARGLEQRLQVLGREYKQVLKGPTVFNDPWWKKHTK